MVDPAAHDEMYYYQDYHHQMVLTPTSTDISQEHLHRGGGSSRRVGNMPNATAAARVPPFITQQPEGIRHFQGPSFSPPPAWLEPHPRGMEMRGTSPLNAWSISSSGFSARASRRPTGGKPPPFRNDFAVPRHAHPHFAPHPLGPAGARNGGGDGARGGSFGDFHLLAHQHYTVPSLRTGISSVETKGFSGMRHLSPGRGGAPTRRRIEFFHPMAPLRETLFLGSPLTHGLGGCDGEINPCLEAGSRILIANSRIGAVIGRGGAIIKHIREVSGAKITISESCRGDHCDTEDRMVTMTGTFNAVQLAITHILSHAGAAGPNANPVMGPCGGDCLANAVRILIPNVKAGGLIGRSGLNIKTIRERSGACITLSTRAFILYTAHGPLQSPQAAAPNANPIRGPDGGIHAGASPRFDAEDENDSPDPEGAPERACGRDGLSSDAADGIAKSTPIVPDRILKAEGTFDACLRAHHLVVWKLMDVRPSSAQTPLSEPAERVPVPAVTTFAGARVGSGVRDQRTHSPSSANMFSDEPFRGGGRNRGRVAAAAKTAVKFSKESPSPAPFASEHLSPFRRPWGFGGPALVPMTPSLPPAVITPESAGGKGSETNIPPQASSPPSPLAESPRGSTNGSVENFGDSANDARAMFVRGPTFSPVIEPNGVKLAGAGAGGGEVVPALDAGGAASAADRALEYSGGVAIGVNGDDGELPPCLVGVFDSFVRGRSSIGHASPPARSPSTMTGIDVAVQRSAFSLLDMHDLDDIKNLSGAGIFAPDSPESFGNLSDEALAEAFVVPGTARRGPLAEGFDVADPKPAANQTTNIGADNSNSPGSLPGPVEGVGEEAHKLYGMSCTSLNHGYPFGGAVPELGENTEGPIRRSPAFGNKGVVSEGGRIQKSPLMKMVRITGTVEEVQLAEYLIRVRTTDLYNAVACRQRTPPW